MILAVLFAVPFLIVPNMVVHFFIAAVHWVDIFTKQSTTPRKSFLDKFICLSLPFTEEVYLLERLILHCFLNEELNQISKYALQKKFNEMEQKLQLCMLAKEDHQKNLNEFEKCHAVIIYQFELIKGKHERLEQNVVEAIQVNKNLTGVNKRQRSEIDNLKELSKLSEWFTTNSQNSFYCLSHQFPKKLPRKRKEKKEGMKDVMQVTSPLEAVECSAITKIFIPSLCTGGIGQFRMELKKVMADLIKSNMTCQHRVGEENLNQAAKEQELQELQQKLVMETELNRKITQENAHLREEKQIADPICKDCRVGKLISLEDSQIYGYFNKLNLYRDHITHQKEIIASLQHMQKLLCRQTETNARMEMELNGLKDKWQTLERDNELQREKAKENEKKFLNLQNEYENTQATWKNEAKDISSKNQKQTNKKENKYTQTTEVSNNLEQEETQVKNIVCYSLNSDEMQTQQNNADINTGRDSVEDCLDNCMTEDDTDNLIKKNQTEASAGKALCTVDFITPGLNCGPNAAECEEKATKEKLGNRLFDKIQASIEIKSSSSCYSLVQIPGEEPKRLLDSVHFNPDTDTQTKVNKHLEGGVPNDFFSGINEKTNYTLHETASSTSETLIESKQLGSNICEKASNNSSETEMFSALSQTTESGTAFHNYSLAKSSGICKVEQTSPSNSTSCVNCNILLCGQMNTYLKEKDSDIACQDNTYGDQSSAFSPQENCVGVNTHTNNENMNHLSLVKNLDLNAENPSKEISEMPRKHCDKDNSILEEVLAKARKDTNKVLLLNNESHTASSSKMSLSLKEKSHSKEIKHTQNSRENGQTVKIQDAIREQTQVPTLSNRVADTLNTGSINPAPKRNPSEEWNAIAKTFYDPSFPTEHFVNIPLKKGDSNIVQTSTTDKSFPLSLHL
ncbi:Coiled-coil domain-containing protein 73 [Varanus komodoensis]|nr:Coiled-coil domain-containing protein 73 [Varanus komodoensis]